MVGCSGIGIGQALAESLRRQIYQAPVSKHFLESAIVSEFDVCIWDGSPGGAVPRWLFLQSLPHFVPVLPLDRSNSGLKFWRWVGGPIPQPGTVPNLWIWSLQVLSLSSLLTISPLGPGSLLLSWHLGLSGDYPQFPIPHCYTPLFNFPTLYTSPPFLPLFPSLLPFPNPSLTLPPVIIFFPF